MRLIDADDFKDWIENWKKICDYYHSPEKAADIPFSELYSIFDKMPTIEAEPVIHCRDCMHRVYTEDGESYDLDIVCDYWETDGLYADDFCSAGQRRTADD